jgi:23S rRNA (adenine2503-C2)-methyltransferase
MNDKPTSITDMNIAQLKSLVISLGEPDYRVNQLRNQIYRGLAFSFDEMTDLPLNFRQALANVTRLHSLKVIQQVEGHDGTIKTLFNLCDCNTVESALMSYPQASGRPRFTVCVSTQAGCAIGCPFCATGRQGFKRNLTRGEIIDQVLYFANYLKKNTTNRVDTDKTGSKLANIVFMGMGEPLANYDALWQAIETLNSPDGFKMGARNMTISTSGLVPQIKLLSREKLQVGLAVSLHAADDSLRDRLVPINRKYPLEQLIPACREYYRATGRRVSFEYILFKGINDSVPRAHALAQLLRGFNCHVNLIPANITTDRAYQPPSAPVILAFERELRLAHINATLRQSRGQDIDAGCGQLRSRHTFASPEQ